MCLFFTYNSAAFDSGDATIFFALDTGYPCYTIVATGRSKDLEKFGYVWNFLALI